MPAGFSRAMVSPRRSAQSLQPSWPLGPQGAFTISGLRAPAVPPVPPGLFSSYRFPPLSPLLLATTGKEQIITPASLILDKVSISPVRGSGSEYILSGTALHH